jgi:ABC-type multidrug transport system fused ATPase/permease subunit
MNIKGQNGIEEFYTKDMLLSVNILWLIVAVFVPLILYYVMFKMALAVDKHVLHKKQMYATLFSKKEEEIPNEAKESLMSFPTNTLTYYWLFLGAGILTFFADLYYPINISEFFIPTLTLIALIVNFFFLILLSDVISKRFYAHQEWEAEMETYLLSQREDTSFFKKRSGLGFLVLSFLTLGIYVYIYLFLVNREYINHIIFDYKNVRRMFSYQDDNQ